MKGSFLHSDAPPRSRKAFLRRNRILLQRKNRPTMDSALQAGYTFPLPPLHSAFYSSQHKICYPKASAFSFQFVLTCLLTMPFS